MSTSQDRDHLSFGDALFLHLEREGIPINIACVAILEGQISLEEFLPFMESKLSHIAKCAQRVVAPPFNIGLPALEYDPEFDFKHHVHETTLKHGTETELKAFAGKLFSLNMDRAHPLWDFTLVHGLKGNRTGLITRMHHSMADGMSGIAFLNALMDPSPDVPKLWHRKLSVPSTPPPDPATSFLEAVTSSWFLTVERLLNAHSDLITMARRLVSHHQSETVNGSSAAMSPKHRTPPPSMEELSQLLPEIASAPERMPFNVVCRGPQKFEWIEVPFDDLHVVKKLFGCTFNDVALTVVASTFRRYAEHRGAHTRGRSLRIVVPVNTRPPDDDSEGMGNQITFVPVSVPLGIRNPRKLMAAVHQRMTMIKQARIAEMVSFAGALIAAIPSPVQVVLAPLAAQLPLTLCNLIFTNVPGPRQPLYVLGHKMLSAFPYVPIGGEMGANCALLTYDGKAHFGFSCDVHATPDSRLLPGFLQESLDELKEAVGILKEDKKEEKKRPATRAKKSVKTQAKRATKPPKPAKQVITPVPPAMPLLAVAVPPQSEPEPTLAAAAGA